MMGRNLVALAELDQLHAEARDWLRCLEPSHLETREQLVALLAMFAAWVGERKSATSRAGGWDDT